MRFTVAWMLVGMAMSWIQGAPPESVSSGAAFVIPQVLPGSELARLDVNPGDTVYVEVEYRVKPEGEALFWEPAEQLWWVQDQGLLLLGSTGLPLPSEIRRRTQAFVLVWVDGEPLWPEAQRLLPGRDGFRVSSNAETLAQKLGARVSGVDGTYLSQVANYLAMNVSSLEVKGETLTIDTDGWFGGSLESAAFRMVPGASAGHVLTSDAGGNASWQAPGGGGLTLPYYGSASSAAALFTLDQTGLGETMVLTADNASCDLPCLRMTSTNRGPSLFSNNSYQSNTLFDQANAGYFQASNPASAAAALYAESFSTVNGMAMAGMQKGANGSAAFFDITNVNNGSPALFTGTLGTGRAFEAVNYHDTSGTVALFKMDKSTNPGHVVVGETSGDGTVFHGTNSGNGKVAEFQITDISNPATVLDVSTQGEGIVASFENNVFGLSQEPVIKAVGHQGGPTLHVTQTEAFIGSPEYGAAGLFRLTTTNAGAYNHAIVATVEAGNGNCVWATHNGLGSAGYFENANTTDGGIGVEIYNDSINHPTLKVENKQGGEDAAAFTGDVHVDGTLSKSAGSFRIDHPLDPEHKYLQHSFVESPDMMNIYNGVVTLDAEGRAWVQLPDWFEALNRSFRYQLTAMGQPAPNLHISKEIENLRFQISGGGPHQRISWQVTGIRHDPYAQEHPIQVELNKTPNVMRDNAENEDPAEHKASMGVLGHK